MILSRCRILIGSKKIGRIPIGRESVRVLRLDPILCAGARYSYPVTVRAVVNCRREFDKPIVVVDFYRVLVPGIGTGYRYQYIPPAIIIIKLLLLLLSSYYHYPYCLRLFYEKKKLYNGFNGLVYGRTPSTSKCIVYVCPKALTPIVCNAHPSDLSGRVPVPLSSFSLRCPVLNPTAAL